MFLVPAMKLRPSLFVFLLLAAMTPLVAQVAPRPRPTAWAVPMINLSLENCYRVSDELYRCEQPKPGHIADLKALGIQSILNLRRWNTDSKALEQAGSKLLVERMEADDLTTGDLVAALRQIKAAPKPVMLHCWHGSDRTGSVVAAYRIVFQGWTPAAALDELRYGGYGYHEKWFPNIIRLFETLDAAELRRRVLE
jgi:protein tyrosine/serine phosphatase